MGMTKSLNIIVAGAVNQIQSLDKLSNSIRKSKRLTFEGVAPAVTVLTDIESVRETVLNGVVDILIVMEIIDSTIIARETTISLPAISEWKRTYPEMKVILVVDDEKKGGIKLKKLLENGYYEAIYMSDLSLRSVADLVIKGRDKETAFMYYGLDHGIIEEMPQFGTRTEEVSAEELSIPEELEVISPESGETQEDTSTSFENMEMEITDEQDLSSKKTSVDETVELIRLFFSLKKRPGMLTGVASVKSYQVLHAYMAGRSCLNIPFSALYWKAVHRLEAICKERVYTDSEKYDLLYKVFTDVLRDDYPSLYRDINDNTDADGEQNAEIKLNESVKVRDGENDNHISSIELCFENCESAELSMDDVGRLKISRITQEISRVAVNSTIKMNVADYCMIEITKPGADRLINSLGCQPVRIFQRIRGADDISQIRIRYENGNIEIVNPFWKYKDEFSNGCQFCEDCDDGSIIVYIIKEKKLRKKLKAKIAAKELI